MANYGDHPLSPAGVYRGVPSTADNDAGVRGRVLLLAEPGGNRDLLLGVLRQRHEVVEPRREAVLPEVLDLCVVDAPSFMKWRRLLVEAKAFDEPVFLPVLLLLPKRHLTDGLPRYWEAVDDFVIAPVNKWEFAGRVELLLRARRLALAQRERLAYVINHDRQTGLPNRTLFLDRMAGALHDAAVLEQTSCVAVARLDLERVRGSLGHAALGRAMTEIARRLSERRADRIASVARLDTYEWGVLFRPGLAVESVADELRLLIPALTSPLKVEGERVHPRVRFGVASYPQDALGTTELLDAAAASVEEAREGQLLFYSRELQRRALRYLRLEARLRDAVRQEAFELHFQPRVRLDAGAIASAEALVRWRLASGEIAPPGEFLATAEETGLIRDIGAWVLKRACETLARWRKRGVGPPRLSVNITPADVARDDFLPTLNMLLAEHDLPPDALELELTETMLFEFSDDNLERLRAIRACGIAVAMDDFGTGYSSLSYLQHLPISVLKVDRSFVAGLPDDKTGEAIVRAVVALGRDLGFQVVAEGIETQAQAEHLREMGCDEGQGYHFSRPVPEAELLDYFRSDSFGA